METAAGSKPVRFDPARYDAWYDRPLGRYCLGLEAGAILQALKIVPGQDLLEVGAGTGRFAAAAAEMGGCLVATEPDTVVATWAAHHRKAGNRTAWVAAWGQGLPFSDGRFDAAFTVTALCFATQHEAIVREMVRVVRPGGRVVLGELNAVAPWQILRRIKGFVPGSPYRDAHFHTVSGLVRMLRGQGLKDIEHEALLHWLPFECPRLLSWAPRVEKWGRRWVPGLGSFVMVAGTRSRAEGHSTGPAHEVGDGNQIARGSRKGGY